MPKVKEEVHVPVMNTYAFRCRQCDDQIDLTGPDLSVDDIKVFHTRCYTDFLVQYKEYGMRIGARIHGLASKKRPKKK